MLRLLFFLAPALIAAAALAQPASENRVIKDGFCDFAGWAVDPDLRGLNVRAGPSADAPIVGTLPPPEHIEDFERAFGTEFDVVEARNGWFRIQNARRWSDGATADPPLPSGWINGRYLDFALQTDIAFAAPDPNSSIVATSWFDELGGHQIAYRHPSDCRGEWVRLRVAGRDGQEHDGWVRGICGIQETTCDGVVGDWMQPSEGD